MTQTLLSSGVSANRTAAADMPPLGLATEVGRFDLVRILLKYGADAKDGPMVRIAAEKGALRIAVALIDAGASVNLEKEALYGPLHAAAIRGDVRMLRLLLSRHADPNEAARDRHDAPTPLGAAINGGKQSSVRALLRGGADPNKPASYDFPPLSLAVRQCPVNIEIVKALLMAGAKRTTVGPKWRLSLTPIEEFKAHDCQHRTITSVNDRRTILRLLAVH